MTMNPSTTPSIEHQENEGINLYYVICEVLVAIFAVVGNALVIFVFRKERRLRRRTNYYIVSLAVADLLVGLLGIPFAIMSSVGLPPDLHACLFTVSLLVVLCTISIFCLVAVSVDRYWAILHPMGYSRNVRTKTAVVIISICWVTGSIVGFLPLMGWHKKPSNAIKEEKCFFLNVMDYSYLVFLYFGTIITPALLLAGFYAHIYQVVLKQMRRIVTMNPETSASSSGGSSGGTMLRMLGAAQKREVKATQNLAIIVLFFMICWIPLYTINCVLAFCNNCEVNHTFMSFCIILSHLNSAGNPLLYAYHLRDFRSALKNFFCNLFGYGDPQTLNLYQHRASLALCNNYNPCRINARNNSRTDCDTDRRHSNSQIYCRKKSAENTPKIATMVKNSTSLVAATTGETNRTIWNIPEASSESSDSSKQIERISIVRSVTPFKPPKTSNNSQINQAFVESSSVDEENDDVFIDDTLPLNDLQYNEMETVLVTKNEIKVMPARSLSTSSPQLSKNLFFVENDFENATRSMSVDESKRFNRIGPLKVVGAVFNKRRLLGRSLSEDGATSNESIMRKSNGAVIRSSCGS